MKQFITTVSCVAIVAFVFGIAVTKLKLRRQASNLSVHQLLS